MRSLLVAVAVLAASSTPSRGAPGTAAADDGDDAPDDLVAQPLVLAVGALAARLTLELGLDSGNLAHPIAFAPDVWLGVTPRLTLGVIHSTASLDLVGAGGSLCFRGTAGTCDHVYRGSGLDARWRWLDGPLAIAPRARAVVRDIDPWKPAVTLGALVRLTRGRFAITADPYLRLGLANRDLGNRAAAVVPLWLALQPATAWLLALHTGWDSELATWRDGWHVPIAAELTHRATDHVDLGLTAGFPHLLGPQNNAKLRAVTAWLEYRP